MLCALPAVCVLSLRVVARSSSVNRSRRVCSVLGAPIRAWPPPPRLYCAAPVVVRHAFTFPVHGERHRAGVKVGGDRHRIARAEPVGVLFVGAQTEFLDDSLASS